MSLAWTFRGLTSSLHRLRLPTEEIVIAGGILSQNKQRNYPTQKHAKLIAAAQKRNRIRKLQKDTEVKIGYVERQKAALRKTVLKSKRYNGH